MMSGGPYMETGMMNRTSNNRFTYGVPASSEGKHWVGSNLSCPSLGTPQNWATPLHAPSFLPPPCCCNSFWISGKLTCLVCSLFSLGIARGGQGIGWQWATQCWLKNYSTNFNSRKSGTRLFGPGHEHQVPTCVTYVSSLSYSAPALSDRLTHSSMLVSRTKTQRTNW